MPTQAQRFIVHWQVGKVTIKYRAVYPPAGEIVWATPPTEVWEGE